MVPESVQLRMDFAHYLPQQIETEAVLLRCCQEAVSNAIRHSGGKRLWIAAAVHEQHCVLCVEDDGVGMAATAQAGMGLRSLRERAESLSGEALLEPRQPRGTCVRIRLPRRDRDDGVST